MSVIKRNKVYHLRYQIPVKLRPIVGKWELRVSLRTKSKRTANTIGLRLSRGCRFIFIRIELLPEVCGLRAADVQSTPEGVTLRITFNDERKIKNQNSIRTVPMIAVPLS